MVWPVAVRSWELAEKKECWEYLLLGMNPGWTFLWLDQVTFCVPVTQIQAPGPRG